MAGITFPNVGGTLAPLMQLDLAAERNSLEREQARRASEAEGRAKEAAPHISAALAGDREALNRVATASPETAMKLAPLLERLDAAKTTKLKEDADYITRTGMAILNAPPEQQPQLYARARQEAEASGRNVSQWPTQYDAGWVKFNVDKAMPVAEFYKRSGEGVTFAPPAGGAPGGDRSANAIAGIESGGRYDAVGPVANPKGQRAYGKYQIMDFNVGPWTQEVLGTAMTPQQFLASPQAQDAVFKAKFGQYAQKYGSPEAAARAWFAGEGGMNNPGATDVLGTTVQGYGQKFAQAYGPGATGPQIAQGDSIPGSPASGGGNVPPAMAPLRGLQLPPGARVALQGGVPIVKDGTVLYLDANGGWGAVPLPQRAAPKEKQAPAGYDFTPEGGLAPIPGGPADPARQRAERVPPGYRLGADGQSLEFIPGGPADPAIAKKAQPMTEGQANAALYADRMRAAEKIILDNQAQGQSTVGKALEVVPGGNYLQSEGYQRYEQARRDFINAVLRRESGAVISDAEFANAEKQYFPRPGDKPDVLKQKAENRRIAIEGISRAAGSTYKPETAAPAAPTPAPAPAAPKPAQGSADRGRVLFEARDAISKGADPAKVKERLKSLGIEEEP